LWSLRDSRNNGGTWVHVPPQKIKLLGEIYNGFLPSCLPHQRWPAKHTKKKPQTIDFSLFFLCFSDLFLCFFSFPDLRLSRSFLVHFFSFAYNWWQGGEPQVCRWVEGDEENSRGCRCIWWRPVCADEGSFAASMLMKDGLLWSMVREETGPVSWSVAIAIEETKREEEAAEGKTLGGEVGRRLLGLNRRGKDRFGVTVGTMTIGLWLKNGEGRSRKGDGGRDRSTLVVRRTRDGQLWRHRLALVSKGWATEGGEGRIWNGWGSLALWFLSYVCNLAAKTFTLLMYLMWLMWGDKKLFPFISGKIEWESPPSILVTRNPNWSQRSGTGIGCVKEMY